MIRTIVAASWNGAALAPRFAPYETAIDVERYLENVPANDVLPKIRATVLRSTDQDATKRWMILRRPAFPRRCPRDQTAEKGDRTGPALLPERRGC